MGDRRTCGSAKTLLAPTNIAIRFRGRSASERARPAGDRRPQYYWDSAGDRPDTISDPHVRLYRPSELLLFNPVECLCARAVTAFRRGRPYPSSDSFDVGKKHFVLFLSMYRYTDTATIPYGYRTDTTTTPYRYHYDTATTP